MQLLFILSFLYATSMSTLTNGAAMQVHDYHCTCKKLSNSTGKDVMIPWGKSAEWLSFYSSVTAGLTKNNCVGEIPGNPSLAIPNMNDWGTACSVSTAQYTINNIKNSGGYTLRLQLDPVFVGLGCTASATTQIGRETPVFHVLSADTNITVCENTKISFYFLCGGGGSHGPYTMYLSDSSGMIDVSTFTLEFYEQGGCLF